MTLEKGKAYATVVHYGVCNTNTFITKSTTVLMASNTHASKNPAESQTSS